MRSAAQAAHVQPKAYLPRLAVRPAEVKWLRASTNVALEENGQHGIRDGLRRGRWGIANIRHERGGSGEAQKRQEGQAAGDGGAEATAASKEAGEEGQDLEEEGDEEEDPAEAPHVVESGGGGVAALAAAEARGDVGGVAVPGLAEGGRGVGGAAVEVVAAAEVEVGPLGDGSGAGDARGVGAQEVRLLEGRRVGQAGEDDEEEKEDGGGHEDQGREAEGSIWIEQSVRGSFFVPPPRERKRICWVAAWGGWGMMFILLAMATPEMLCSRLVVWGS